MRIFLICLLLISTKILFSQSQNDKLAYQYFAEKQYEKAIVIYKQLYKKKPKKEYYEPLLECYLSLERNKEAEKLTKYHLKKHPDRIELGIDQGYVLEKWGKPSKANLIYENVLRSMNANVNSVLSVGNKFYKKGKYDYAIKAYKRGAKLLHNDYPFAFELAKVYETIGNLTAVSKSLIGIISFGESYLESIKAALSSYFYDDSNGKKRIVFKEILLDQVQKNPSKIGYTELLIWFYLQEKKFSSALIHAIALDKRNKEDGDRIFKIAEIFVQNKDYDIAIKAYKYILEKKDESYFYRLARSKTVEVLNKKIDEDPLSDIEDIDALRKNYENALKELGRNSYTMDLIRGYALLLAFHFNDTKNAKRELQNALKQSRARDTELAKCKISLADIYIKENNIWEATLLYGQVNHDFKEDIIGYEAKFKGAKTYFYGGDFEWAKTQLDVLKASTTKLIANDALQLSVLISDNLGLDSSNAALELYARADLYNYQNNDSLATICFDSILELFPNNLTLLDDVYFMKAKIQEKKRKWIAAINNYQEAIDYNDLLKDDALYRTGVIYQDILEEPEKAISYFEKIILNHEDSFYAFEARKRFRILRGDFDEKKP